MRSDSVHMQRDTGSRLRKLPEWIHVVIVRVEQAGL